MKLPHRRSPRLAAGAGEVDARRVHRGRAVVQVGEFRPALRGRLDPRSRFLPLGRFLAAQPLGFAADLVGQCFFPAGLRRQKLLSPVGELIVGTRSPEVTARVSSIDFDDLVDLTRAPSHTAHPASRPPIKTVPYNMLVITAWMVAWCQATLMPADQMPTDTGVAAIYRF